MLQLKLKAIHQQQKDYLIMIIMEDAEIMDHISHTLFAQKTEHQLNKLEASRKMK